MNESIKKFMDKLSTDEELQAKLSAVKSPEEAFELAKSVQDGFSMDEFIEACKAMSEADEGDISDEDLAATAGGVDIVKSAPEVKESLKQMSVEVPRSGVESAIAGRNLGVGDKVSGVISASVTKVEDKTSVTKYVSNVAKTAGKAIKNALP